MPNTRHGATTNTSFGSAEFRQVLGHFPTGLAVVTAVSDGRPVGMVANSVTAVSLDPPLVLFCPSLTSTTWPRLKSSGGYCINLLDADSGHVSRAIAGSSENHLHGAAHRLSAAGRPVLDAALAWLDCDLWAEYPAGDHVISVARVIELERRDGLPIVFFRSSYRRLVNEELLGP